MSTNFKKPVIFFALIFLTLISIQSYYLYNTAQLWKSEIYRDVRNRLDGYLQNFKETDLTDDIAAEALNKYENGVITKHELIQKYNRGGKFNTKNLSADIDSIFRKDAYTIGLRKQLISVYSYQAKKEILQSYITLYKTKNNFKEGKNISTGEWSTHTSSKSTEDPKKNHQYSFLVKDITNFDILNINTILFQKLAPQLLLNFVIGSLILYIFYRTLKNLRDKVDKIIQLHTTIDSIAHELNTPLTTLKFALPTIENQNTKSLISRQIKRLEIISSTIHNRDLESELMTAESLNTFIKDLQNRYNFSNLHIDCRFDVNKKIQFSDFKLIIDNLIENASKYGANEISVKIFIGRNSVISVTDNGIGIPDAEAEKIFEKYYRIASAKNSEINGLGMGLFLVKQTVEKYNGKISVKSLKDENLTFKIEIRNDK